MTIQDLLDQGIQIQGYVLIRKYDDINNKYITLFEGDGETFNLKTKGLDSKILYMYSRSEKQINSMYTKVGLYIEVE